MRVRVLSILLLSVLVSACNGGGGQSGSSAALPQMGLQSSPAAALSGARVVAASLTKPYARPSILPDTFTIYCPKKASTGRFAANCAYYDPGASTNQYAVSADSNCGVSDVESLQTRGARIGLFRVTGYSPGLCTVSLTDSNQATASATIDFFGRTILGPLTLTCPAKAISTANCTYADPGYAGTYSASTSTLTCASTAPASGAVTASDTAAESCTLTLTAVKTGQQARATITFAAVPGPLTLNCPTDGVVGANGVQCTYSNPNYSGDYTVTTSSSTCGIASQTANGFAVSDSAAEACTITLTPSSGTQAAVQQTVTFVGPLVLSCPNAGVTGGTGVTCTYTNPGYTGTYTLAATGSCATNASTGGFTVSDATSEACTVTLTPGSPETSVAATITFSAPSAVGPLSLTCPSSVAIVSGPIPNADCTYTNPNYTGGYTASTSSNSGHCSVSSAPSGAASGGLAIAESSAENCTVTLHPTSGTESDTQASVLFIAGSGGGGGGGCAVVRKGIRKTFNINSAGHVTPFVVQC